MSPRHGALRGGAVFATLPATSTLAGEISAMERYERRPVRFLELWTPGPWRIKVYGIAHRASVPGEALVGAARRIAAERLRAGPTRHRTHGVGFLGIHEGRGYNQAFLDLWINENELHHTVWISPPEDPAALAPAPEDYNSVCVWDLGVQAFEREAWIEEVLARSERDGLDGYLARTLDGEI